MCRSITTLGSSAAPRCRQACTAPLCLCSHPRLLLLFFSFNAAGFHRGRMVPACGAECLCLRSTLLRPHGSTGAPAPPTPPSMAQQCTGGSAGSEGAAGAGASPQGGWVDDCLGGWVLPTSCLGLVLCGDREKQRQSVKCVMQCNGSAAHTAAAAPQLEPEQAPAALCAALHACLARCCRSCG